MKFVSPQYLLCLTVSLVLAGNCGCRSTVAVTNTDASGSQQLLLNSSADAVVSSFDFTPLADRLCHLDTSGLGDQSEGYVAYQIRKQMMMQGVRLTEAASEAEVVVEAGLSAYGTDYQKDEVGIIDANDIPDLHLCTRDTQYGVAKLSMFAWEKESGHVVWQSPTMRADSFQIIRKILGTGPYYSGTIQHSADRIERRRSSFRR